MTLTEPSQTVALDKEPKNRDLEDLIASSQKLLMAQQNNVNGSVSTPAAAFTLHPESADKPTRQRKPRKTTVEDYDEYEQSYQQQGGSQFNGQSSGSTSHQRTKGHRSRSGDRSEEYQAPPPDTLRDPTSDSFSAHAYSWPIAFALIPPLGALVYGKSDIWSDALLLMLIAFYLYNIIKVPWELYHAARAKRIEYLGQTSDLNQDARRSLAARELRRQEFISLIIVIISPWLGGKALHFGKEYLTDYDKYISNFNINLFVFAAAIRPIMHVISLVKSRAIFLQEQVHYPSTEVELLKRRVQHLEHELSQLRRAFATKRDVMQVKDGMEPALAHLGKTVRRHEKKISTQHGDLEQRFDELDARLRQYETYVAAQLNDQHSMTAVVPRNPVQLMMLPFTIVKYLLPRMIYGPSKPLLDSPSSPLEEEHYYSRGQHLLADDSAQENRDMQRF